jgi:uncharacterized membrane protein YgdD (TMEM256/DUF423 family)
MKCARSWLIIGCIMACLAVVIGAFGAHGIEGYLKELYKSAEPKNIAGLEVPASYKYMEVYNTGVDYHMFHALGLIALGLIAQGKRKKSDLIAAWSFVLGIVLFCGPLYVLALTGKGWLGAVAPLGGTLMIVAWIALACSCKRPAEAE